VDIGSARGATIAASILGKHDESSDPRRLRIRFDALASHDITYVGIVQTSRASGLTEFPVPYVLTNCHNSLCAVGGTINEDDHLFGLTAAKKYGGIFVPAHQAVIHQYVREMVASCGSMVLGSDSHTRYGALGCMGVGEGGPELAKQLLRRTYDVDAPEVVAVYLEGAPVPGVGPQDVALALIRAVFASGFAKNKILEFVGPGIAGLSADYRNGIDVMTTETTCLSSIWRTDGVIRDYYRVHGREDAYAELAPGPVAYYDGAVVIDLASIRPMIALPFHPSNAFEIDELNANAADILSETEKRGREQLENTDLSFGLADKIIDGRLHVDQGSVAGCAGGTYENICAVADILGESGTGIRRVLAERLPGEPTHQSAPGRYRRGRQLLRSGVTLHPAFCGPCFGAGDTPANGALSIRHATRNFPHREGSKPSKGRSPRWPSWTPAPSRPRRSTRDGSPPPRRSSTGHRLRTTFSTTTPTAQGCTGATGKPILMRPCVSAVHRGLACHARSSGESASGLRGGHPRSGHHHRRNHPFRRDLLVPVQPDQIRRVHLLPKSAWLCRAGQADQEP
jgi:aconitate hydratase